MRSWRRSWDKACEETLARQIKQGVVPPGTQLTKRPEQIPTWDSLSDDQKRVFARMMEVLRRRVIACRLPD
jgi:arylsulfatase